MTTIIGGSSPSVTFPDSTVQDTSAIVSGKVPYTNLPAGSVVQAVTATYSTETSTSSNVWSSTGLTATITPKSSSNKILILVNSQAQTGSSSTICPLTIFRGTTSGTNLGHSTYGFGYLYNAGSGFGTAITPTYLDSPATTSAQQYTVAFASTNNSTTVYVNVSGCKSSITLLEIVA